MKAQIKKSLLAVTSLVGIAFPNLRASSISLTGLGDPTASQLGVYRVERNTFRKGGHGWESITPTNNPNSALGANYTVGSAPVSFSISDVIPTGSMIQSASLSWSFSGLTANAGGSVGAGLPNGADIPREHGGFTPCSQAFTCSPAKLQRFAPAYNFYADHLTLEGVSTYSLGYNYGVASGSVDLLQIWSADDLATHKLDFVGSVVFNLGRPFFDTEGLNADTEFDVSGLAKAHESANLNVGYSQPSLAPAVASVPEPGAMAATAIGLIALGLLRLCKSGDSHHSF